uniref:Uncharacterized protein n=1 Tax=Utricularia reniformis TaxID=192314 RepID=A0A1Y0B2T6_9LAMI|nr:hypothetical protein AEK19_MT1520 [Utricularia reniformis]ART31710.1 hypothetical protein AEK19_MT1520 [Utricularia reniformis]
MFLKQDLMIYHKLTKEHAIALHLLSKKLRRIGKKSGWLFVSLYCKQAAASLMNAYGGDSIIHPSSPSLTRKGYPRIISAFHRKRIYKRDGVSDLLVKLYLSIFSVSKVILLATKISKI